jgi:hypothetical protein
MIDPLPAYISTYEPGDGVNVVKVTVIGVPAVVV